MVDFKGDIDFNYISELLDSGQYESQFASDWNDKFVLKSVFKIRNIETHGDWRPLYDYCQENFNKSKKPSNLFMFFSLKRRSEYNSPGRGGCVYNWSKRKNVV